MPRPTGARARMAPRFDEPLVGRDEVIREVAATAYAAAVGAGSVVLLTGDAGIGKTSVARHVSREVRGEFDVSWGRCLAEQSAPPFWPWRPLITVEPSDERPELEEAVGAPRFERLRSMRRQLQEAAGDRARLHVLEDLQWADVASVLLLADLTLVIAEMPLLVLATLRTGEPLSPQLAAAIAEVRRASRVWELHELDDDDVAALIRSTGAEPDDQLLRSIRHRTGGNALFVTELLRAMPRRGPTEHRRNAVSDRVPARVSDLVLQRLGRLPAPVTEVLVTASVLGDEGDTATLAAAHGGDVEVLVDLLEQGRAAHVLDTAAAGRWRFRHQLVRDAVYSSVTGSARARRHALILEALAANPATPPAVLAHHALLALPIFDVDRAVALAARAGEAALAQLAYEEAIDWFGRAISAAPPDTSPRWRAELLLLSGEAQRHLGAIDGARQAFLEAAELTDDPALLARAALGYASPGADLGIAYRTDDAVTAELLERAIAAQPSLDAVTAVQLEARLAAELYFSDDPSRSAELGRAALERARRLGDERALGIATAVFHDAFVVGHADLAEQLRESGQLLEWARATGSVSALLTAHRARVLDLLAAGDTTAMDAEILAFRRLAEPLRAPGYLWWPAVWAAMRALLEGRHDLAEQRAIAAFQLGEGPFPTLAFSNMSFLLFFLRREQGRLAEMEQAVRDYAAANADIPALRVALTFLLAELGRVDEARGALGAFDDEALAQLHDRNWPASWFQLARAASIVGDRDLAATLLEPRHRPSERCVQISLATACLGATDLAAAWLLHTVGDHLDAADAHYRLAEELHARIGARSWLAQTRADHARLLLQRGAPGDREEASRLVDLAQAAARDIGLATVDMAPEQAPPGPPKGTDAVFRRDGSVWELGFADRVVQLPDARGLRDLAYLLGRRGESVSVLELAGDGATSSTVGRGEPALDERARREIRERLRELDTDEADAEMAGDGERAALVREQRQALAEAVARDFGLGGRARRIGDPVERARKTVSTRIRRTITAVGRAHPELGRHLERSIDTGAWCAYRPAEPVDWRT